MVRRGNETKKIWRGGRARWLGAGGMGMIMRP